MTGRINRTVSTRRLNTLFDRARRGLSRAASLLARSGRADQFELEHLEQRQLLFALTITPELVDPNTGIGTARAFFGYAIPYFAATSEVQQSEQQEIEENFDQSNPGVPGTAAAVIPAIYQWPQSEFRVENNTTLMTLVRQPGSTSENEVSVLMTGGQSFTLGVSEFNVPIELFAITFRGGFSTDAITVELLFEGNVIDAYTGAELAALAVPPAGTERRFTFTTRPGNQTAFDQIRFRANPSAPSLQFRFDDLTAVVPGRAFDSILEPRLFGVTVAFSGPAGATAEFFDLYDRPMRQTIAVGRPPRAPVEILLIDPDGDGVPNFNDGIGRVVMSNVNGRSALTMWGGTIQTTEDPPPETEIFELPGFAFLLPTTVAGFFDDFESAGFGYALRIPQGGGPPEITGLPTGQGTLIIGSPFVRPLEGYNPGGTAGGQFIVTPGVGVTTVGVFNRANQGIFVTDGSNMGSVYIHGILHGSSKFHGYLDRLNVGYMVGSAVVRGDLGSAFFASDVGMWVDDDGTTPSGSPGIKTNGQLVVHRTIGEVQISGRSQMNITVLGDLNSPLTRPARDSYRYYEREFAPHITNEGATVRDTIRSVLANNAANARNDVLGDLGFFFGRQDQATAFGTSYLRNDSILNANWVGSITPAVQIYGDLGRRNPAMSQDNGDIYGFAVDGTQDILVQVEGSLVQTFIGTHVRLVDSNGRTVASPQFSDTQRESLTMRYSPDAAGVYYLVVQTPATSATNASLLDYVINLSGLATTTFGALYVGGSIGEMAAGGTSATINIQSGSMGALRSGVGFLGGNGATGEVGELVNVSGEDPTAEGVEDTLLSLRSASFTVAGNLYQILSGGDIQGTPLAPVTFNINGDVGIVQTGLHPSVGQDPREGDLRYTEITTGGSIGYMEIMGAIGVNQDAARRHGTDLLSSVVIRTGTNPQLRGDIGFIRVGSNVGGDTLVIRTPSGSIVGGFVVSQDLEFEPEAPDYGIFDSIANAPALDFNLGSNSDFRFFDAPKIDQFQVISHTLAVPRTGQGLELTDDAGGRIRVRLVGGDAAAFGEIILLPISGSLGVAVGRITVDLSGGAVLEIVSVGQPNNADVISIGRIEIVNNSEETPGSIRITGTAQVDVWRILQTEGEALNEIVNTTPGGDIVAVDVIGLTRLQLGSGSLGRTQMPAWGPQLIGPFLGIGGGSGTEPEGPIALPAAAMTPEWNGQTYRPLSGIANPAQPPSSWLDDIGAPIDPYLDGLLVREGNLQSVEVGGAIGDVITNAPTSIIANVVANSDLITPAGQFHGIVGNIMASRIGRVDIGDGLAASKGGPLSDTGITATDDINLVLSTVPGASIRSNVIAANVNPLNATAGTFPIDGINRVELTTGGHYIDAWIGAMPLDGFWNSFFAPDDSAFTGDINQIVGVNANFLRSNAQAINLNTMTLTNGFYDASIVHVSTNLGSIQATGYRNSTLGGGELEFHENRITSAGDIGQVTTTGMLGDIEDIVVQAIRRIGQVGAHNVTRSRIDAASELNLLQIMNSLRGSEVTTGRLLTGTVANDIVSSRISVAGPLEALTVADRVSNTHIRVTGPDGRIGTITVANHFGGTIDSAGPIGSVIVTNGDMVAQITTMANQHGVVGNVGLLQAGRDLDIRTDISGTISQLIAGRHIGNRVNPGTILVHGDVMAVSATNGQLYSDLRVGQVLHNVTIGRALHRPAGSDLGTGSMYVFGRIGNVTVNGDFGGNIVSYSGGIGVVTIQDGSLLPGALIAAYDGNLQNLFIRSGNLYGNVHADYTIMAIRLDGSADGVFGHVGINPAFSAGTAYDNFRNQHPPGVIPTGAYQGPRITAGHNFGRLILTNGSVFETFLQAGRAIGTIEVAGDIRNDNVSTGYGTVIAAGSSIFTVRTFGSMANTLIMAGVRGFGDDMWPGGIGTNADSVESGRIQTVDIRGSATNVKVSAGMDAGGDGLYNTADDLVVLGISYVREVLVGGTVTNTSVYADSPTLVASPGIVLAGTALVHREVDIHDGSEVGVQLSSGVPFNFSWNGETGTILYTGSGKVFWDGTSGRLLLISTSLLTDVTVTSDSGRLTDFKILSNDDASIGVVTVNADLFGDSRVVIDAYVMGIRTGDLNDTSTIRVGMNIREITTGAVNGGNIEALYWARDIRVNGNFGTPAEFDEARINANAAGTILITGANSGLINMERDLISLVVNGPMDRAQLRSGSTLGSLTTGGLNQTRVSVRNTLGPVVVNGNVNETAIQAGGDLGGNVMPGANNDATTGHITSVTVGGSFVRSSIVAGLLRGPDGFFGTTDDSVAPGRSTIGDVTIAGPAVGSNLNSEQYRIASTGAIGAVTINGAPGADAGNFRVREQLATEPTPIRVEEIYAAPDGQDWVAWIDFNQPMNVSTIGPAMTISEVRTDPNVGIVLIPLVQGVDYTFLPYDALNDRIGVLFARHVTDRNLDDQTGAPGTEAGPGIFRFQLDSDVLRAAVVNARLGGDREGFGGNITDFSDDIIVGDAGDKLVPEVVIIDDERIDFYGPADLDLVLDNNYQPDGLPDPNQPYTIRGRIGDHPDHGGDLFRTASDTDLYRITLRAGQIIRMGELTGPANLSARFLLDSTGAIQSGVTDATVELPSAAFNFFDSAGDSHFLVKETGTYFIVVTNSFFWDIPGFVPEVNADASIVGDYRFTVEVFDDGNSGFAADTQSGNGAAVANAPAALTFAGPNLIFGDADDLPEIIIGNFVFTLDAGPDGVRGTEDDIVRGDNGSGITSTRIGDQLFSTIQDAIGPRGHAGVPNTIASDVDIFHLNNRQPIEAGQLVTIRVKLADIGADLGSFTTFAGDDFRGDVQFAVFDTTGATDIDDALLVFSPGQFSPIAGEEGLIAGQGDAAYGYDENGDFFITFVTPGLLTGSAAAPASYAVYLQGVFNTDYEIEIEQSAIAQNAVLPRATQNVFLETRGGYIDWLEVGGLRTELAPFASAVLGFTGSIGGLPVDQYILNNLVSSLEAVFAATGVTVNFSTNPSVFEFQDFSKVFLTRTNDPITVFNTNNFGYSEGSDPFNLNRNDESVVFLPSMTTLGYTPSINDVDNFILSLTAAVGRRVGEMLGLRITADDFGVVRDIMSSNSVQFVNFLGGDYVFPDEARALSTSFDIVDDSNFFLGQQNSQAMLARYLRP